jgi:hypothetical protein
MATRQITPPAAAEIVSPTKAARLCAEWSQADADRLELDKQARALKKRQEEIAGQLVPFVDAAKRGKERTVTLPRWRLEIHDEPPHAVAIAFAALGLLRTMKGQAEIDKLTKRLGTKPKLAIDDLKAA